MVQVTGYGRVWITEGVQEGPDSLIPRPLVVQMMLHNLLIH